MTPAQKIRDYTLGYIEEGWKDKLEPFLCSKGFESIVERLSRPENRPLTPPAKVWFRAFKECPYEKTKVVLMAQDAYYQEGVADGLAFSCSNTGKPQPSLVFINEAINLEVPPWEDYDYPTDLTRWANQGVLLINTALTTKVGEAGKHIGIWRPFTEYLMKVLNEHPTSLIFCLWGNYAKGMKGLINSYIHDVIEAEHPAAPAHRNSRVWNSNASFEQIRSILAKRGQTVNW